MEKELSHTTGVWGSEQELRRGGQFFLVFFRSCVVAMGRNKPLSGVSMWLVVGWCWSVWFSGVVEGKRPELLGSSAWYTNASVLNENFESIVVQMVRNDQWAPGIALVSDRLFKSVSFFLSGFRSAAVHKWTFISLSLVRSSLS